MHELCDGANACNARTPRSISESGTASPTATHGSVRRTSRTTYAALDVTCNKHKACWRCGMIPASLYYIYMHRITTINCVLGSGIPHKFAIFHLPHSPPHCPSPFPPLPTYYSPYSSFNLSPLPSPLFLQVTSIILPRLPSC